MVLVDCDPVVKEHLAEPIFAKSAITLVRGLAEADAPRDVICAALERTGQPELLRGRGGI
jgi:hypothetical protein